MYITNVAVHINLNHAMLKVFNINLTSIFKSIKIQNIFNTSLKLFNFVTI